MKTLGKHLSLLLLAGAFLFTSCAKDVNMTDEEMITYAKKHYGSEEKPIFSWHVKWDFTSTKDEEAKKLALEIVYSELKLTTTELKGNRTVTPEESGVSINVSPITIKKLENINKDEYTTSHKYILSTKKIVTIYQYDYCSTKYPIFCPLIKHALNREGYAYNEDRTYEANKKHNAQVIGHISTTYTF